MTKTVGITFGAFDLLHPGHVVFLQECKGLCEALIIGLHVDPSIERSDKNKPIESVFERYVRLAGMLQNYCDIIPYETERDLVNMLSTFRITDRFLGGDYIDTDKEIVGLDICQKLNIKIHYLPRLHDWSSSRYSLVQGIYQHE